MSKQRAITVSMKQRKELSALLRRTSVSAGLAKRARAILLLAEGVNVSSTGRMVSMQHRHLYKWIVRFREQGIAGLADGIRTGRPPVFSPRGGDSSGQDRLRTAG